MPWSEGRARSGPLNATLLLDGQPHSRGRELETRALCRALQFDRDAVLVLHDRDASTATHGRAGAPGRVVSAEVSDVLQVRYLAGRSGPGDSHFANGEPIDLDPVLLAVERQGPVSPAEADPNGYRALRDVERAGGGVLGLHRTANQPDHARYGDEHEQPTTHAILLMIEF